MNTTVWIVLFVIFVITEACTYQMVSTWFAIGSVAAAFCAALGMTNIWQVTIFICVSLLCLLALRPVWLKCLKGKTEKTNTDSLVGGSVVITSDTDGSTRTATGKINGMEWSVKSEDDRMLSAGESVYVKKIEGVKLIVSKSKGE